MTIYIIRPKTTLAISSLDLISRKFTPESRQKQVHEVLNLQREDPNQQEILKWAKEVQNKETIQVLTNFDELGVTGTTIVNTLSAEADEQILKDLPRDCVLVDQPIELIQPRKAKQSFKREQDLQKNDLWHLSAIGLETLRTGGLDASGKGVGIVVLDTGVDGSHPALRGKITGAYEFEVSQWQAKKIQPSLDTDGHGTHVAGLICGKKIGVAPEATVLSGVMIPKGRGTLSNFILGLEWAAKNPDIQIVNISAGLPGYFSKMEEAVAGLLTVGVLPVCAVGNDGQNKTRCPGNYRDVISVGASNEKNGIAGFSSSGTLTVNNHIYTVPDLVAPGKAVYSSVVKGGYEAWDGTSMATPIVSGIASLILERYNDIEILDLREELFLRCQKLAQFTDERQGHGLIQVKLREL
ncbi:MAG: S8 family serine peptidase [Symploca sp. SIO2G7]|nr:S8 family serine peptidase [Symploca sp. SIO2G7]